MPSRTSCATTASPSTSRTHQHRAVLERLAAMTGGRYWPLDDLDGLAAAIPYSKAGVVERQTLDLWNLPIVFLVLLA